jgi:phosphatidylethanolamine-binding protein (PEBP) family uncharacterized protein
MAFSVPLTLFSQDIAQGEFMPKIHEFKGYRCSGDDLSPHLKWSGAPEGKKVLQLPLMIPIQCQAVVGGIGR